ncbi:response regulator transcription factor [Sphingopyxis sp. PET50]|uniref:response regulator transcription factor n=1 Tax=Sphingopyxis sp. PET50 TaxID=2976533 RepID=UPI0021B03AC0|nr:response regulator [Sphingopyxis sp. PET50]
MPHVPTVAIVDDDEAVREALGDLLMVSGLACHCFESAADFLAARRSRRFDCLVTDIRMPGMNGIELIERLHDERARMPVVVLSSVLDEQTRMRALALGARAWLAKPVTDAHLLGALASAMGSAGPDTGR